MNRIILGAIILWINSISFCFSQDGLKNEQVTIAHSHNDYNHQRPLLDALERGFRSIEADVFLEGDSLYVAHEGTEIKVGRTAKLS